jgi:uncharacterized protein (DUF1015 family)
MSVARVEAFAGIRYDTARVVLDDVVAPPYDVINDAERAELAARSRYNSVAIDLPVPDDDLGLDRYANAAHLFEDWLAARVLRQEGAEAVYVYRMSFGGKVTTGLVAALGLGADVLPHEETTPKPKGDRLELLRATGLNTSPIWGLSGGEGLGRLCAAAIAGRDGMRAEAEGVVHELWSVKDPALVAEICDLAGDGPILLADGHHRYETACAYAEESGMPDAGAVMAYIAELSEDELQIGAINRLVSGLPDAFDFVAALRDFFEVGQDGEGIEMLTRSGSFVLRPTPETDTAAGAELDSARLAVALAAMPAHELIYQHGRHALINAVRSGSAQAAFFLRPPTVGQIAEIARGGRRMPPKTTFFHPKPRTGMIFRRVS